jgi:Ni,Fe-hydrogenase I large subunit
MALSDILAANGGLSDLVVGADGKHEVDPISRIEGHLGVSVQVDTATGVIQEADAHGNLWRGFENFLIGRNPNDAITFVQRICGVCPVPHGMTSTFAVESVYGLNDSFQTFEQSGGKGVPRKAMIIRNLILSSEFLMSSITHFYHLAAPSYVQGPAMPPWTPYFNDSDYSTHLLSSATHTVGAADSRALPTNGSGSTFSSDLWSAVIKSYVHALRIRRLTFEAAALFAGRMPMTSSYVAGGVTFDNTQSIDGHIAKFDALIKEVAAFVLKDYVPITLALGILYPAFDNVNNAHTTGDGLGWGAGLGNFLSWGAFPTGVATKAYAKGVYTGGVGGSVTVNDAAMTPASVVANLTESIARSHYADPDGDYTADKAYPGDVKHTVPDRNKGYSWMKAPRWGTTSCEVGPLARVVINGLYPIPTGGLQLVSDAAETAWESALSLNGCPGGYGPRAAYANIVDGAVGLKPSAINPDIAVGAVRSGLADLWVNLGVGSWAVATATGADPTLIPAGVSYTSGTALDFSGLADGDIAGYYNDSAIIFGIIGNDIVNMKSGLSTMDRLRARSLESLFLVQLMVGNPTLWGGATLGGWLNELDLVKTGATWRDPVIPGGIAQGFGATEAPRGALMHQITIDNGKITKYQCIVPTTWNGSPKNGATGGAGVTRGAIEEAMIGAVFAGNNASYRQISDGYDPTPGVVKTGTGTSVSGVEPLRIAQSFDPCIACAVH